MPDHAILNEGAPVFISPQPITFEGIQYPRAVFSLWTREQKLTIGIYEIQEVVNDTSTGPDTVTTRSGLSLADGVVSRTTTIRDMTAQEIEDRNTASVVSEADQALGKALYLAFNSIYYLARNPHNASLTLAQFKTAIENEANQGISEAAFIDWLRQLRFGA